jgi:membrane associated rhomboid family serine protease
MTLPMPSQPSGSQSSQPVKKERTLLPAQIKPAVFTVGGLAAVMVIVQIVNSIVAAPGLVQYGIQSRTVDGLVGVLFAPLIHVSWGHLLANLIPFLVFGVLLFVGGVRQFVAVTILVWLVSGLGVWLVGPSHTITVGASGLVFGWLAYLVARGVFTRNWGQIAVGLVLLVLWGGLFWTGIVSTAWQDLTGDTAVSWQGHLFGAIGGVLAAFLVARADKPNRSTPQVVAGS